MVNSVFINEEQGTEKGDRVHVLAPYRVISWKGPLQLPGIITHPVGALRHLNQMMPCAASPEFLSP